MFGITITHGAFDVGARGRRRRFGLGCFVTSFKQGNHALLHCGKGIRLNERRFNWKDFARGLEFVQADDLAIGLREQIAFDKLLIAFQQDGQDVDGFYIFWSCAGDEFAQELDGGFLLNCGLFTRGATVRLGDGKTPSCGGQGIFARRIVLKTVGAEVFTFVQFACGGEVGVTR